MCMYVRQLKAFHRTSYETIDDHNIVTLTSVQHRLTFNVIENLISNIVVLCEKEVTNIVAYLAYCRTLKNVYDMVFEMF